MLSKRPMVWMALCSALGITVAGYQLDTLAIVLIGCLCLIVGITLSRNATSEPGDPKALSGTKGGIGRKRAELLLCILGGVAYIAGAWQYHSASSHLSDTERTLTTGSHYRTGTFQIESMPEAALADDTPEYWRCPAIWLRTDGDLPVFLSGRIQSPLEAGDRITGRVRILSVEPQAWPGAFDERRYLRERGRCGQVQLVKAESIENAEGFSIRRRVEQIRASAIRNTLDYVPGTTGAFLAAVMFGYRGGLPPEIKTRFHEIGIGHLLAISGLHVGLVAGLFWWLFSLRIVDRRKTAALCIIFLVSYLVLTGGRIAAIRAGIMAICYLAGFLLGRKSDFTNALGLAALILLFWNPFSLFNLGFQLSFVAVLFISRLVAEIDGWRGRRSRGRHERSGANAWWFRIRHALIDLVLLSVTAWLGVWPLVAYGFCQFTPVSLVVNIIALPLMSVSLACGLCLQFVGFLPDALCSSLSYLLSLPSSLMIYIAEQGSALSPLHFATKRPEESWLVLYYLLFGFFFLRRMFKEGNPIRKIAAGALPVGLLFGGMILGYILPVTPPASPRITLLPGRSSDTAILELPNGKAYVSGPLLRHGMNVMRYLRYRQIKSIDKIVWLRHSRDKASTEEMAGRMVARQIDLLPWQNDPDVNGYDGLVPLDKPEGWRIQYCRDRDGRMVLWSLGKKSPYVIVSSWSWSRQVLYRLKRKTDSWHAPLYSVRLKDSSATEKVRQAAKSNWFFTNGKEREGVFMRERYGVIVLNTESPLVLKAYDGNSWQTIPMLSVKRGTGLQAIRNQDKLLP